MNVADLLDLPEPQFLHAWASMEIEERAALPPEIAARCRARYTRLTPYVEASIERARRAEAAVSPPTPPVEPLPGYVISAVWEGYTAPEYLVKRLLAPDELTVLFGASGHFKSVLAIDLALSVATGAEFHGMRTRRAGVLYVAGEGHAGIRKRARAWLIQRGYDASSEQPGLYVTSAGANLIARPEEVAATVQRAAGILGADVRLVVVDTLAANFGPGDENHATDMQLAIAGARRAAPGAAVLLVHHVGHGQAERERGSYALVAAADCRVQATYDEPSKSIELRWHKLKDDERPEPMLFNWRAVPLGWEDEDGEELSSVVLEAVDAGSVHRSPRPVGLGKNQETALKSLRTLLAKARKNLEERGDDPAAACILTTGWRADLERRGISRQRFHDLLRDLQERRLIAVDGPHVAPIEVNP